MTYSLRQKSVLGKATVLLPIVFFALLFNGCRSRGKPMPPSPQEPKPAGAAGSAMAGGESEGEQAEENPTGPKIMGYQFWTRHTFGLLKSTYSDEQENQTVGRKNKIEPTSIPGKRYILEHYPIVYENFPKSEFGYSLLEIRQDTPDPQYWEQRITVIALMGYILPSNRLIAPVVGIHAEFNKISLSEDDSPEVAKSDIRAWLAGVHWRQKIWGTGSWIAFYYNGRVHLMNLGMPSSGYEYELGLGSTFSFGGFRTEFGASWIDQTYNGKKPTEEDEGDLIIKSRNKTIAIDFILWI